MIKEKERDQKTKMRKLLGMIDPTKKSDAKYLMSQVIQAWKAQIKFNKKVKAAFTLLEAKNTPEHKES
jgi:hypothetical protein